MDSARAGATCGGAPSCPAGGRRGASASPSACPPSTGATNARAVSASRAPGARLGSHGLLGRGSPLAHSAPRPGVASQRDRPPTHGHRRSPLPVHRGGAQSLAPSAARDSAARRARPAPRRRPGRARQARGVRGPVRGPTRRIDGERDAHHMSIERWPRLTVLALIRAYQLTLSHLAWTQCRFVPSCSRYTSEPVPPSAPLPASRPALKPTLPSPPRPSWLVDAGTGESDTTALSDWRFSPSAAALHIGTDSATLTFSAERGGARVSIAYRFSSTEYHFGVRGRLEGFGASGATLLVGMGDGLRSVEADSLDDFRHYAILTKAAKTHGTGFESLKPGERKILDGPFEWAGVNSNYFFLAALTIQPNQPQFAAAIPVRGSRT